MLTSRTKRQKHLTCYFPFQIMNILKWHDWFKSQDNTVPRQDYPEPLFNPIQSNPYKVVENKWDDLPSGGSTIGQGLLLTGIPFSFISWTKNASQQQYIIVVYRGDKSNAMHCISHIFALPEIERRQRHVHFSRLHKDRGEIHQHPMKPQTEFSMVGWLYMSLRCIVINYF